MRESGGAGGGDGGGGGGGGGVRGAVRGLPRVDGGDGDGEGDVRVGGPERVAAAVSGTQLAAPPPAHPHRLRRPLGTPRRPLLPSVPVPLNVSHQANVRRRSSPRRPATAKLVRGRC